MKKSLLLLIAFIALFFSCSDDLETSSGTKDSADGKTYLVIGGASFERTIMSPSDASVNNLKKISLKGTISGGTEETLVPADKTEDKVYSETYSEFSKEIENPIEIEAGTWAFILSAELEGIAFSCKKEDVSIEAGKENKVTFELVAVNDASGLSITLTFPMNKNIERVETVLKKADETTIESKDFTDSNGDFTITEIPNGNETEKVYSIVYSRDINNADTILESGTYHITFNFYANGITEPINSPDYYVRVAKGFTIVSEQNVSLNETYSIAYVENGGVLVDGETQTMKYFRKSEVELPEMEKSGYVFVGWYEDKDFTKPIERIAKESTGNKTLYAAFINSITVSANGTADANVLKGDSMESINSAVKRIVEFDTPIDWTIFVDGKLEEAQEIGQELKPSNAKSLTIEGVHENTIPDDSAPTGTDGYTDIIVYKALSPEIETINNTASAFYISTSAPVIIKNIKITGAGESGMGGGICMATHLVNVTLESGTWITGNVAGMYGGGVAVNGTLTMKDGAVICDNRCDWRGGGVFIGNPGAKFYMEGGIIRDNSADEGSGVYVSNTGSLTMSGTAYINSNNDVGLEVIDAGVLVGDLSENTHEIVATVTPAGYEVGYSVLDPAEGVTLTKESINKFAIVQPTSSEYDWIIDENGKLEHKTTSASGNTTTDNRAMNIEINRTSLYLNLRTVKFSVAELDGSEVSDTVTYGAKLLYNGQDVNKLGDSAYYTVNSTSGSLSLIEDNPLPKAGTYQLYVTAERPVNANTADSITAMSSQTFEVTYTKENYVALLSLDVSDSDFGTNFGNAIASLEADMKITLSGAGSASTISTVFNQTAATSSSNNVTVDMSAVTGIESISSGGVYISRSPCLKRLILPDSLTSIGEYAFAEMSSSSDTECYLTLVIGKNVESISLPYSGNSSPFKSFEVAEDNENFKTNEDGSLLLNKAGDTIVWGGNTSYALTLPDSVTRIGKGAFYSCSNIAQYSNRYNHVISLNKVTRLDEYAFCQTGAQFELTETLVAVGTRAFHSYATITDSTGKDWYYVTDKDTWEKWISGELTPGQAEDGSGVTVSQTSTYVPFKDTVGSSSATNYMYRKSE